MEAFNSANKNDIILAYHLSINTGLPFVILSLYFPTIALVIFYGIINSLTLKPIS